MSRKFQVRTIPSTWLETNGRRLDCGPYLSGAMEARELLRRLSAVKEPLASITKGIYHAGREGRLWVESPEYGVPFMGSTDILASDLSNLPLISKKQVRENPDFTVRAGWTLITRSGTIGRMAYARADMDGIACSEHVMRVVPNTAKVKPGYVFAYLSSRFGLPIVLSGTYGSIIQSIEPHHIEDLPVPRLGNVEDLAHELIQRASDLRTKANELISKQVKALEEEIAGGPVVWQHKKPQDFSIGVRTVKGFFDRLDAFHHIGYVGEAFEKARVPLVGISRYADALYPPFMKRIRVQEGGVEFLGGTDALTLNQKSDSYIASNTKDLDSFIVRNGYVLFQCDGQRYGIFGRPILANRNLVGKAVTQHMMRIIPNDIRDAGYIFTFLATEFGRRLLMRFSAGTSIPSLNEDGARKILIFWPDDQRRHSIGAVAEEAWEYRAEATCLEDQARSLVEQTIEEGGR